MLTKCICLLAYELQFHVGNSSDQNQMWFVPKSIFFDMSEEDNALLTWQFNIFATDSSRPNSPEMHIDFTCVHLFVGIFALVKNTISQYIKPDMIRH